MKEISLTKISLICILLPLILSSCALTSSDPSDQQIWIDVPLNGLNFDLGQPVNIEGHAASAGEDNQVQIWVNADQVETLDLSPLEGNLSYFSTSYAPPENGDYIIQAVLIGTAGENLPADSARITVGGAQEEMTEVSPSPTSTITPRVTLTPTITETPTSTSEALVDFWADPLPVQAGGCTTIYWEAENVNKLIFGGSEQPLSGSYQVCEICEPQTYRLIVTYMDNREETIWLEITVDGSCATPTSTETAPITPTPADTTPPPIPTPYVPADGLSLSCRSSQSLTWMPVNDPSGIAQYQVEIQRSSDNNTWSSTTESPKTGVLDKTTQISTECGWYYRWRVRALDEAGNASDWSSWSYFSITLT